MTTVSGCATQKYCEVACKIYRERFWRSGRRQGEGWEDRERASLSSSLNSGVERVCRQNFAHCEKVSSIHSHVHISCLTGETLSEVSSQLRLSLPGIQGNMRFHEAG